jgi:hypothetical protein
MTRVWQRLVGWYPWLSKRHPIAQRDISHATPPPLFFRRLTEVRSMLGYASLIHLVLFILSMVAYSRMSSPLGALFAPFLTPFGLPLSAAFLHSILYWAMLLGIGNQITQQLASEMASRSFTVLRLTPYSTTEVLLAKITAVRQVWWAILVTLIATRLVASISVPIAAAVEAHQVTWVDAVAIGLFVVQPLTDALLAASLSTFSAVVVHHPFWARMLAHALMGIVLGALALFSGVWLVFTSPIGAMGGIFAPFSHWALLAVALIPTRRMDLYYAQIGVMALVQIVIPLLIACITLALTIRIASRRG